MSKQALEISPKIVQLNNVAAWYYGRAFKVDITEFSEKVLSSIHPTCGRNAMCQILKSGILPVKVYELTCLKQLKLHLSVAFEALYLSDHARSTPCNVAQL